MHRASSIYIMSYILSLSHILKYTVSSSIKKNIYYSVPDSFNLEKCKSIGHQSPFTRLSLDYGIPTKKKKKVLLEWLSEIPRWLYPSHQRIICFKLYTAVLIFLCCHISSSIFLAHERRQAVSHLYSIPTIGSSAQPALMSDEDHASLCWGRFSSCLMQSSLF